MKRTRLVLEIDWDERVCRSPREWPWRAIVEEGPDPRMAPGVGPGSAEFKSVVCNTGRVLSSNTKPLRRKPIWKG